MGKRDRPPVYGDKLSERERQTMWLVCEGFSNKQIAEHLGITEHTAKFHTTRALIKLVDEGEDRNRTKAAIRFMLKELASESALHGVRIVYNFMLSDVMESVKSRVAKAS